MEKLKKCAECGELKFLSEFYKKSGQYRSSNCKKCDLAKNKKPVSLKYHDKYPRAYCDWANGDSGLYV